MPRREQMQECWHAYSVSRLATGEKLTETARRYLGPLSGARVLDIGCGSGAISASFAKAGAKVFAADLQPGRAAQARAFMNEHDVANVDVTVADGCQLPFIAKAFDFVTAVDLIEHVADPGALLREISRVLTPSGVAYVSVPNKYSLVNLLYDPHYGVPAIGILPRRWAEWYVTKLLKLRPVYTVDRYFSMSGVLKLFRDAGLRVELMPQGWVEKLKSGTPPTDPRRAPLYRLSQARAVRPLALRAAGTRFFEKFVAGAWEFTCRAESTP